MKVLSSLFSVSEVNPYVNSFFFRSFVVFISKYSLAIDVFSGTTYDYV